MPPPDPGNGRGSSRSDNRTGITRNRFLQLGGVAVVSAGIAPAEAVAVKDDLRHLRLKTYKPLLRARFEIQPPHGPVDARLVEVADLRRRGSKTKQEEAFSLLFEAERRDPFPQGTYTLRHRKLGTFELFLVPVGRGAKGFYLEAIVNRIQS